MPGGCSPPARAESWEGPGNRGWSSSEQEGSGRAPGRTHGQFIRGVSRDSMALKFLCEPESLMGRRRRRGEERVLEGRSRERCGRGPCEGRGAPGSGSTRPVGAEGGGSLRWKEIRVSLGRSGGAGLPGARGTSWTWPRRPALPH